LGLGVLFANTPSQRLLWLLGRRAGLGLGPARPAQPNGYKSRWILVLGWAGPVGRASPSMCQARAHTWHNPAGRGPSNGRPGASPKKPQTRAGSGLGLAVLGLPRAVPVRVAGQARPN